MKKTLVIILTLICFRGNVFAQSFESLKINISNSQLKSSLAEYNTYLKKWTADNKKTYYIITVDQDKFKDNTIFTLNAIAYKGLLGAFNASHFAIIDGVVILFRSGLEPFTDGNPEFRKYIQNTYWKGEMSNDEKKYNQSIQGKKFPPNTIPAPYIESGGISLPKSWILIFNGQQLVSTTADLHQQLTQ